LNNDILDLLVEKFPDGYEREDVITFRNLQNELVDAVEVRTEDTIYLVKVSKRLADTMENYDEGDDANFDDDDEDIEDLAEASENEDYD
jgi:hypothetical protein